ncbi:tetratricopeptide repeat protein [Candidatus Margulisiibacteriota bacterium]
MKKTVFITGLMVAMIIMACPNVFCNMSEKAKALEIKKGYELIEELAPDLQSYVGKIEVKEGDSIKGKVKEGDVVYMGSSDDLEKSKREALAKKYNKAISIFEKVLKDYPNDYKASFGLGRIYYFGYNMDESDAWPNSRYYFLRAIHLNKKDPEAYEAIGPLYGNAGRYSRAIQAYFRALNYEKNKENIFNIYSNLSLTYYMMGNVKAAVRYAKRALGLSPNDKTTKKHIDQWKSKATNRLPNLVVDTVHSGNTILYKNNEFKFTCRIPIDWEIVKDAYEWTDLYKEKTVAYIILSLPQAPIYDGTKADNIIIIQAFGGTAKDYSLNEFIDQIFSDNKKKPDPVSPLILKGTTQFAFAVGEGSEERYVDNIFKGEKGSNKYIITYSAKSSKYKMGRKDFDSFVNNISFL